MTTPIDKAALEGASEFGVLPDEMGEEHRDFARGVFASIDTNELARALAVADGISWDIAHGAHKLRYLHYAEAMKAHLLKEGATDD